MVLHALFSNSIGSVYELEAYIKSDIIKHGVSLSNMLHTLEEVVSCDIVRAFQNVRSWKPQGDQEGGTGGRGSHPQRRERGHDVRAQSNCLAFIGNTSFSGLGDIGEDIYGFRELGLDTEFGLKSLVVPKRLLRPKAKTAANDEYVLPLELAPETNPFCAGVRQQRPIDIHHHPHLCLSRRGESTIKLASSDRITITGSLLSSRLCPHLSSCSHASPLLPSLWPNLLPQNLFYSHRKCHRANLCLSHRPQFSTRTTLLPYLLSSRKYLWQLP